MTGARPATAQGQPRPGAPGGDARPLTSRQQSRELAPVRQLSFTASEVIALVLLSVGAFALPVLLPLVGLALLWRSRTWRRSDKGVATALVVLPMLLVAGGLGFVLLLRSWSFG
jgi:hypothetical protein